MKNKKRTLDERFKGLELKVGVMVAVALAGVVLLVVSIGLKHEYFTKKITLRFVSNTGAGLTEGMPVKLSGFRIGVVSGFGLTDDAGVEVTLAVLSRYERWLRKGTTASFVRENFIGDGVIELQVPEGSAPGLTDGETIEYIAAPSLEDLVRQVEPVLTEIRELSSAIREVRGDVTATVRNVKNLTSEFLDSSQSFKQALKGMNQALAYVNDPKGDLRTVMANLGKATTGLDATRKELDRLLGSANKAFDGIEGVVASIDREALSKMVQGFSETSGRLSTVLKRIEKLTGDATGLTERIPEITEDVARIAKNVRELTGKLNMEGARIADLIDRMEGVVVDGQDTLQGVRGSWPVRKMLPPQPTEPGSVSVPGTVEGAR